MSDGNGDGTRSQSGLNPNNYGRQYPTESGEFFPASFARVSQR